MVDRLERDKRKGREAAGAVAAEVVLEERVPQTTDNNNPSYRKLYNVSFIANHQCMEQCLAQISTTYG